MSCEEIAGLPENRQPGFFFETCWAGKTIAINPSLSINVVDKPIISG
jgi:hypothetical protein